MRTFNPFNLVQLPRFNTAGAIALGAGLQSAYKEAKPASLPKMVTASASRLFASCDDLRAEYAKHVAEMAPASDELRGTDVELDGSWSSLESLLGLYARLPVQKKEEALKQKAAEMHAVLFPDGLKFILLPYKQEWAESQARLDLIDERAYGADIEALGGAITLAALRRTHQKYGDLQGLSKVAQFAPQADIRGKLDAFNNALRDYIVRVSASVDPDIDGSDVTADQLLAFVSTWQSTAIGARGGDAPAEAPAAPTTPNAPTPVAPATPPAAAPQPAAPTPVIAGGAPQT